MGREVRIAVKTDGDIVIARQKGREIAAELGFEGADLTVIATAISEIARNIVEYTSGGEITMSSTNHAGRKGFMVVARDHGPGIRDVNLAMQDGYTTSRGLGLGLPGARRLMDEFEIDSKVDRGTTVTMKKWLR